MRFHEESRGEGEAAVHVEIDVLENVAAVFTVLVSRSSSSCGSERAGHSTASSRSPGFCRCATRVFRSALLWRQLEAWQVGSALHAIRRQGGPEVCPTNGPPPPPIHPPVLPFLLSLFLSLPFFLHLASLYLLTTRPLPPFLLRLPPPFPPSLSLPFHFVAALLFFPA